MPVHPKVKLPKLSIKKFNGDITTWPTFWDSFQSAIHDNTDLTNIDKFNYLHLLLEPPASDAISGLKLTAANYVEAVDILKKRFGNKQRIISKHMDILLNLEPVTSQHDLRKLRQLYDLVESQVRGLTALGVGSDSYGSLLCSILMNKLPQEFRLIISREVTSGELQLDELLKSMEQEIEVRENVSSSCKKLIKDHPTTFTLTSTESSCCYCQLSHLPNNCKTLVSVDDRKLALADALYVLKDVILPRNAVPL